MKYALFATLVTVLLAACTAGPTPTSAPATATLEPPPLLIDFEGSVQRGVGILAGEWQVVDDGTGNHVFQNEKMTGWPGFAIGPAISDGVIEYRVKYLDYDTSADNGSGMAALAFRIADSSQAGYVFALNPYFNRTQLQPVSENGAWEDPLAGGMSTISFNKNVWYEIRLVLKGPSLSVYLNGELVAASSDDRFHTGGVAMSIGPYTQIQFDDVSIVYHAP